MCELDSESSSRAGIFANAAFPLTKDDFVNVAVAAGGITERATVDPFSDFNLGGFLQLSGLRTDQLSGNYLGFAPRRVLPPDRQPAADGPRHLSSAARSRPATPGADTAKRRFRSSEHLYTAGSVFLAADTWLGPFYFAWGRASGGQSSFYILPRPALTCRRRTNAEWLARSRAAVWHPCTQMKVHETLPLVPIARGDGAWLYDFDGPPLPRRRQLVVGQPVRPRAIRASTPPCARSSTRSPHVLLAGFTHRPVVELSERLAALAPAGPRATRSTARDGASATEIALKMSFHYWRNRGFPDKRGFVSLAGSYHGETLGALAVTDVALFRDTYAPLLNANAVVPCPDPRVGHRRRRGGRGARRASRAPSRDDRGADRRAARAGRVRHDDVRRRATWRARARSRRATAST